MFESTAWAAGLPDLTISPAAINPHVVFRNFTAGSCIVNEGCAQAGTRRLLVFTTETKNVGTADLVMGNPATNGLFVFDPCHLHYHYNGFAAYRLRDTNSNVVLVGTKIGFCLEDVKRWDPQASPMSRYDCDLQGIQKGWSDVYTEDVPCQWLDITELADGPYVLELEVNPDRTLVESFYGNNVTTVPLTISAQCTPFVTNDSITNAETIPGVPYSVETYNSCAGKEQGEPSHAGNNGGHSLWYRLMVEATGPVRLSTDGSDFNTLLAVYAGTNYGNLQLVASNNDAGPGRVQSALTFEAEAGTVYSIAVDGNLGAFGKTVLNVEPPLNDLFTNCVVLDGNRGRLQGHNIGATREASEPDHNSSFSWRSVWFCWTAPFSGPVMFDTVGSRLDTLLAVYTGNTVGALTAVTGDNDSGGNQASRVWFEAAEGTTYRVCVDGVQGQTGEFTLSWSAPCRLSINKGSAGWMELSLSGGQGLYELQASADLVHWSVLTNVTLDGTTQTYADSESLNLAQRFYRVVPVDEGE